MILTKEEENNLYSMLISDDFESVKLGISIIISLFDENDRSTCYYYINTLNTYLIRLKYIKKHSNDLGIYMIKKLVTKCITEINTYVSSRRER